MSHRVAIMILGLTYLFYVLGIEWAAAIVGWRFVRKSWAAGYKWLVALTSCTVVVETAWMACLILKVRNVPVYNIWALVETGLILYIQYLLAVKKWPRRSIVLLLVVLVTGTAIFFTKWPMTGKTNIMYYLFNMFVQLIGICVALIDIVQGSMEKLLSKHPAFWLNIGLLFYCSIFIVGHIWGLYSDNELDNYFIWFSFAANTFMYFGIIACFRTLRKEDK